MLCILYATFVTLTLGGAALMLQRVAPLRALGRRTLPVYLTHQLLVVSGVAWVSATWGMAAPVLHVAAPVLVVVVVLPLCHAFGRLAPRVGLGWLFDLPRRAPRAEAPEHPRVAMVRSGHPGGWS